ncbi:MAG: DUF3604 domain-containing protein [Proteobacteria bacterium]|nr:DUF3604 domain-containing protein [Pseudomonadota bacterium]
MLRIGTPRLRGLLIFGFAAALAGCGDFDDPTLHERFDPATAEGPPPRAEVPFDPNRNLLWGDLHVHTSFSFDAFTNGVRTLPDDAYTYMKGGAIEHAMGYPIRARRPLDFGAVTDHAKFLGIERHLAGGDTSASDEMRAAIRSGSRRRMTQLFLRTVSKFSTAETRNETFDRQGFEEVSRSAWSEIVAAAERHDDPGLFTTFVGYEWSSVPDDNMLHRNVIYGSERVPDFPFSALDSEDPEDLWRALDEQRRQGMDVLAIPHNGNLSGGRMFESTTFEGGALTPGYAAARSRNEPLVEIFQIKGSSEAHPSLSPEDPFADFELLDPMTANGTRAGERLGSYSRDALRTGLEFAHRKGFNPFRFGVIGSSDSHNSSSSAEEDNYHGKLPIFDGTPAQRLGLAWQIPADRLPSRAWGAAGLVAVWAEENTRPSIFRAMRRKETYATSGPRMSLRFFAGWDYPQGLLEGDWLADAYRGGVPMGGTLEARGETSPVFVLAALKDPLGANLDRVQIVKLWVDADGRGHERVFDVAASDDRRDPGSERPLPDVGNTVEVARASYTNAIGAAQLFAQWTDPEFDASRHALYYARAIEIPTPRHTTYAAKLLGVRAPEPTAIQERAVSSAIWIRPAPSAARE